LKYLTTKSKDGSILLYEFAGIDHGPIAKEFYQYQKVPLVYTRISKLGSKSNKGSIVEYAKGQFYGNSVIPQNQLTDDMWAKSMKIFSMHRNVFQARAIPSSKKTEIKLEYGDLFSQKDVSLSNEDIVKNNLDQILKDNNIKRNKDC
jgi:hypothetical protein